MKKVLVLLAGVAALVGAGYAWSSHAPESSDPRDAVWGGGRFDVDLPGFGVFRDLSVMAKEGRFEGADGSFVYGRNGLGMTRVEISCINVEGNRAVIAGRIRDTGDPTFVGGYATWWLSDNGGTASPTRDRASLLYIDLEGADLSAYPAGFPKVCPSATTPPYEVQSFELKYGDLVVHDAVD